MSQKDLVVKMTINSKEFENGLQNAKQSVKSFDSQSGLSALTKKIGALGLAMKAVDVAKDTFIKGINSTEASADKAAGSMRALTKSYDAVIQALANGNTGFSLTIDNLAQIAKNAKAAYEALDKLGTFQMWSSADRSIINAQIAEDRVIVNSKTASEDEKKAAQERINANTQRLQGLTQQYLGNTRDAQVAVLREVAKATDDITNEMLAGYVESWKKGTLKDEALKFYEQQSREIIKSVPMTLGDQTWTQQLSERMWSSPAAENQYRAMMSLVNARETDEGWNEYFKLVKEEGQIRTEIANTINKANRASEKTLETTKSTGTPSTPAQRKPVDLIPGMPPLQTMDEGLAIMEKINARMQQQAEMEETNAIIMQVGNMLYQQRIDELNSYATTIGQCSNMFAELTNLAADGSPWQRFGAAIGGVLNEISKLMSTYASLIAIESVAESIKAGQGIPFPYNLIAILAAGTALIGIISSIKGSAKDAGSFATGGIVGGNSYTGDHLIAHVNSGEMILNRSQQSWLFGAALAGSANPVIFTIEGSMLRGVLDNYDKTSKL